MLTASVKRSPAETKVHLAFSRPPIETQRCMMGLMQMDVFGTLFIFLPELYSSTGLLYGSAAGGRG